MAHLIVTIILYLVLFDTVDLCWSTVSLYGCYSCTVLLWDASGNLDLNGHIMFEIIIKIFWGIKSLDEILEKAVEVCSV